MECIFVSLFVSLSSLNKALKVKHRLLAATFLCLLDLLMFVFTLEQLKNHLFLQYIQNNKLNYFIIRKTDG